MSKKLRELLKKAKKTRMTDTEQEQQRRSFAYGNANIENDEVSRETVKREAEALAAENES